MPRIVPADYQAATEQIITSPGYLVDLYQGATHYRYATRGTEIIDGVTWYEGDVRVSELNPDANTASVEIGNLDLGIGALILGGLSDWNLDVYSKYKDTYPVLLVAGVVSNTGLTTTKGTIKVVPEEVYRKTSPRIRYNNLWFSRLPQPGLVIRWGNEEFTVESPNG